MFIAPENGQDESTNISDDTWEKLSLMPQSSICEMAFSLDRYYNVEEIPILKESDILCKYYILDTGENISNDSPHYFGFDEQYWSIATRSEEFDIIKKPPFPCGFIDKIEWMLNYDDIFKQIAPYLANNTTLKERHEYLRKNGLFTYAIIVEGKASDLIELRKIGNIMYPQFYP